MKVHMNIDDVADWPIESWELPERTFLILEFMATIDFEHKKVLDLGSHYGMFSYAALQSGADYVFGIDQDTHQVQSSSALLAAKGFQNCKFLVGNFLEFAYPTVDIVMAMGVFYHTNQHYLLAKKIKAASPKLVLIETLVRPSHDVAITEWDTNYGETLYIPSFGYFRKMFSEVGLKLLMDAPSTEGRLIYLLGSESPV